MERVFPKDNLRHVVSRICAGKEGGTAGNLDNQALKFCEQFLFHRMEHGHLTNDQFRSLLLVRCPQNESVTAEGIIRKLRLVAQAILKNNTAAGWAVTKEWQRGHENLSRHLSLNDAHQRLAKDQFISQVWERKLNAKLENETDKLLPAEALLLAAIMAEKEGPSGAFTVLQNIRSLADDRDVFTLDDAMVKIWRKYHGQMVAQDLPAAVEQIEELARFTPRDKVGEVIVSDWSRNMNRWFMVDPKSAVNHARILEKGLTFVKEPSAEQLEARTIDYMFELKCQVSVWLDRKHRENGYARKVRTPILKLTN